MTAPAQVDMASFDDEPLLVIPDGPTLEVVEGLLLPPGRSVCNRNAMLYHYFRRNIVIRPFSIKQVNTTSYDCRLGPYFYREKESRISDRVFNPYDEEHVRRFWEGPYLAPTAQAWSEHNDQKLSNIRDTDRIIVLGPQETILAHTEEFIGGRVCIGQEMRARSTMGRIGITVCKCAGWGDIGFINRWTMEITNHLKHRAVVLIVGTRVSQLIFIECDPMTTSYAQEAGKYQASDDIKQIMDEWLPDQLRPKLYMDKDLKNGFPAPRIYDVPGVIEAV